MKISRVLLYTIIVSLGGFIFGFDAIVISGTTSFLTNEFGLTDIELGFVVSAPTLGAIIATLSAGVISDAIGRRNLLIIIAFLYLLSAIASALASGYLMLVVARFIGGLAFCSLMIAPMYIAEIAQPEKRGRLVSINQLNIVIGLSVAFFSNYYLLQLSQSTADWAQQLGITENVWRWMLGMETLPALLWFIALFFIPKSPRWLMTKQREEEAKAVLNQLHGDNGVETELCRTELQNIRATLTVNEPPIKQRLRSLFDKKMHFALMIGVIVGIAQQATGVNAIYFYAPSIFEQSGIGTNAAFAQAIWLGLTNVVFTIVAMLLIDKLGRKPLLIGGLSGVVLSMAVCAYGFGSATYQLDANNLDKLKQTMDVSALKEIQDVEFLSDVEYKNAVIERVGLAQFNLHQGELLKQAANLNSTLILLGILGFVASFAVSLGPVMWVMFSEIFPNAIRGIAISFVGVINSATSWFVQFMFPWELANLGAATTFAIFGIFAVIGLFLVAKLFPETKGKTLEQLEVEFSQRSSSQKRRAEAVA